MFANSTLLVSNWRRSPFVWSPACRFHFYWDAEDVAESASSLCKTVDTLKLIRGCNEWLRSNFCLLRRVFKTNCKKTNYVLINI